MHADILEGVFNGIVEAIHEADNLEIYTSGATNMLKYPELSNPEHTTALLDTLVEKKQLVKLVDDTVNQEEKHGIQVYIGNETQVQSLRDRNCYLRIEGRRNRNGRNYRSQTNGLPKGCKYSQKSNR